MAAGGRCSVCDLDEIIANRDRSLSTCRDQLYARTALLLLPYDNERPRTLCVWMYVWIHNHKIIFMHDIYVSVNPLGLICGRHNKKHPNLIYIPGTQHPSTLLSMPRCRYSIVSFTGKNACVKRDSRQIDYAVRQKKKAQKYLRLTGSRSFDTK